MRAFVSMCGIAGIVDYNRPLHLHESALESMRASLAHRGPDDDGIAMARHAGLVHTRLAVIDPAGGQQPLVGPDRRFWITYNGEIYNHRALRRELASTWRFVTDCDTEVVLAAWARWGKRCLDRLNGMFAFFLWDDLLGEGYLVRDRLGVKPLAVRRWRGTLCFASEASALVRLGGDRPRADRDALEEYLVAPCFSGVETSMFAGVDYLQPGHLIHVTRDRERVERWWDYELEPSEVGELRAGMEAAVRDVLVSDVPIGHFLSGGFDSTLVASLATRLSSARETAYTIAFEDQAGFDYERSLITKSDDTPYARAVADELGLRHELVALPRSELPETLRRIARINDALPAWEQEVAQHALARAASRAYKVVLVGDAADETHYGYGFLLDEHASAEPANLIERFGSTEVLLRPSAERWAGHYRRLAREAGHGWKSRGDRILATTYLVVKRWLPRLLHNGDIHTMRFGLEARVPFSDAALLDVARRVPPDVGFCDGREKAALRGAVRGLMPEAIRMRPKSALPKDQNVAELYARELRRLTATDGWSPMETLVQTDAVVALCERGETLTEKERALLFRLICLYHWQLHHEAALS